jgi:small conductance mechanosensitive channel
LFKALYFLFILFVFRQLSRFTRRALERWLGQRANISGLLRRTGISVASGGIMIMGALIAFSQIGVEMGPLLAGLGVVGFILGFALQGTLANFASGLLILAFRPFEEGDTIEIAGKSGTVLGMTLVATTLQSFKAEKLVVPNGEVWSGIIENKTGLPFRGFETSFQVHPKEDIDHVMKILKEIVEEDEHVMEDPEPSMLLWEINEQGMKIYFNVKMPKAVFWGARDTLLRTIKRRFDEEQITLTYRILELPGGYGNSETQHQPTDLLLDQ